MKEIYNTCSHTDCTHMNGCPETPMINITLTDNAYW